MRKISSAVTLIPMKGHTMLFVTSDWHLGHNRILEYCQRPFDNVDDMDDAIIDNFNEVVKEKDLVLFVGDFCFRGSKLHEYVSRLVCKNWIFMLGNHDYNYKNKIARAFSEQKKRITLGESYTGKTSLAMYPGSTIHYHAFHCPCQVWYQKHYGALHFHGHCHGGLGGVTGEGRIDVGVDVWGFKPLSLIQVLDELRKAGQEEVLERLSAPY
jgi:calcineurin-like phosphoesterase family protein